MGCTQDMQSGHTLANKPSVAFSSASASSATTSRSGGSKLLFGEIDTSSDRSSQTYASVGSFVLCDSSTFLKFWLEDKCRERFLSHVDKGDLANLRLTCHDFSVRAAPTLFQTLRITFRSTTFTKPARLAALDRLGFHVQHLTFDLPHSPQTFLAPLVDPQSGAELSFTYTPQIEAPTPRKPKYGDAGTNDILTRQWPALFHAATNVPAFIRVFSAFVSLSHLTISCPGYDSSQRYRRSTVDFALISLRIAIERNNLNSLESLTLSPIHPDGLAYLLPRAGYGATPRSARTWSRVKRLAIAVDSVALSSSGPGCEAEEDRDHFKLLQTYLRNFQSNLTSLDFRWNGSKGVFPIRTAESSNATTTASTRQRNQTPPLYFPNLSHATFHNIRASASEIRDFTVRHKRTISELRFDNVRLASGEKWKDALAPLTDLDGHGKKTLGAGERESEKGCEIMEEIPIMLAPPTARKVAVVEEVVGGRLVPSSPPPPVGMSGACGSSRLARWLAAKGRERGRGSTHATPTGNKKTRGGLRGALRGGVMLTWR